MTLLVVLIHAAAVWFMTGSIWTMQVLNYPLMALVGPDAFVAYETAHNRRFLAVVGPAVAVTTVTTALLLVAKPDSLGWALPVLAALLLLVIIALTARYQAPAHTRLARGFDPGVHATLVRTNWVRTAAWTVLGILDLIMVSDLVLA